MADQLPSSKAAVPLDLVGSGGELPESPLLSSIDRLPAITAATTARTVRDYLAISTEIIEEQAALSPDNRVAVYYSKRLASSWERYMEKFDRVYPQHADIPETHWEHTWSIFDERYISTKAISKHFASHSDGAGFLIQSYCGSDRIQS